MACCPLPCGYCLEASMTGRGVGLDCSPASPCPVVSRLRGNDGGGVHGVTGALPHLWIDESLITLCQRVRLQRRRTLFFIILVPMNGRTKSAMTGAVLVWLVATPPCGFPPTRGMTVLVGVVFPCRPVALWILP